MSRASDAAVAAFRAAFRHESRRTIPSWVSSVMVWALVSAFCDYSFFASSHGRRAVTHQVERTAAAAKEQGITTRNQTEVSASELAATLDALPVQRGSVAFFRHLWSVVISATLLFVLVVLLYANPSLNWSLMAHEGARSSVLLAGGKIIEICIALAGSDIARPFRLINLLPATVIQLQLKQSPALVMFASIFDPILLVWVLITSTAICKRIGRRPFVLCSLAVLAYGLLLSITTLLALHAHDD